jgi:hypothetical protein
VIDSPKEKSASIQTCQESDKTLSSHMFKSHSSIDSSTMQTNQQHTDQRQEVHQAETDNHLREKIKLMKEKLHKANQELIHIQDQDKNSSQDL